MADGASGTPPLLVSDATAEREGFRDARAWRKFARAAQADGYAVTSIGAELAMLRADVEAFVRASRGASVPKSISSGPDEDAIITDAIERAGLRRVGGSR